MTKIAILGSAPHSRLLAPFEDKEWTIWACSPRNIGALPRIDVWFEMHDTFRIKREWRDEEPVFTWLNAQSCRVYMIEQNDIVERAERYPIEDVLQVFAPHWFHSTVAYMLALALVKHGKEPGFEFGLWGVNMAGDSEYALQKPDLLRMLEWAQEHKLPFYIPPESSLATPPILYGYSEGNHIAIEIEAQLKDLAGRQQSVKEKRDQLAHEEAFLDGLTQGLQYVKRTWAGVENVPGKLSTSSSSDDRPEQRGSQVDQGDALHQGEVRPVAATFPERGSGLGRERESAGSDPRLGVAGGSEVFWPGLNGSGI